MERGRDSASNKMTPSYRSLSYNAIKKSEESSCLIEIVLEIVIVVTFQMMKDEIVKWGGNMNFIKSRFQCYKTI